MFLAYGCEEGCQGANLRTEIASLRAALEAAERQIGHKAEWIPVTERFPMYMVSVLAYDGNRILQTYWTGDGDWSMRYDFTHWMPLPEPPDTGTQAQIEARSPEEPT